MPIKILSLLLICCALAAQGGELRARLFTATPPPQPGEIGQARALLADGRTQRLYVLDSRLARVAMFSLEGEWMGAWAYTNLVPMPPDPMLPTPLLAASDQGVWVLQVDRANRKCVVAPLEGPVAPRTLTLPDGAANGAVTLTPSGALLVAYLTLAGKTPVLVIATEGKDGAFTQIAALERPCGEQAQNLSITGLALAPDGRLAVGLAQTGAPNFTFQRSWLVQRRAGEAAGEPLQVTHSYSLIDARGRVLDRFRPAVQLAGTAGYPARPCVPLFAALAFGADGALLSGGHSTDPFLRVYRGATLLASFARAGRGGQHLASLPTEKSVRLFTIDPAGGGLAEITADGRTLKTYGASPAFDLTHPLALAADIDSVYVAVRGDDGCQLLRFTTDGRFRWMQPIAPPPGMDDASPSLVAASVDGVFIGWRAPKAAGIGWVDTLLADGTRGLPLWTQPVPGGKAQGTRCPAPMIFGGDARCYVLRETADGPRLQAISSHGVIMQTYPPAVQGVTAVALDGSLGWVRPDPQGLIMSRYTKLGAESGWRRVPQSTPDSAVFPAQAREHWGWLTTTQTLLQFGAGMNIDASWTVRRPDGTILEDIATLTGDGARMLYLATPGRIYAVNSIDLPADD